MNKLKICIAVCLVASLLVGGLAYAVTVRTNSPAGTPALTVVGDIAGDPRHPQEPHKTFRLVRYRGAKRWGSPLSAGSMVLWHTGALTGDGVTVTDAQAETSISGDNRVAGIMVTGVKTSGAGRPSAVYGTYRNLNVTADIRNYGSWGWLQTYGKCRVTPDNRGKMTAGAVVFASNLRGQATGKRSWWAHHGQSASPALGNPTSEARVQGAAGFWMDDVGTSSRDVFLRCE